LIFWYRIDALSALPTFKEKWHYQIECQLRLT
jgi:hypothetical protein